MLKHLLIASAYFLLALAVALVLPAFVPGVSTPAGFIAGGVVLVAGALAHEAWARFDAAEAADDRFDHLRAEIDRLRADNFRLDGAIAALIEGGDTKAKKDLDRVVSEVRVLQTLIEQLPTRDAAPSASSAQSAGPGGVGEDGLDDSQVLEIVREGLKRDRVDLYLQPVVSLPQRKTRFYECFSRIRAEDGRVMLPDRYLAIARREGFVGAIDNLLLFRCVQLVRRAQSRNHSVGFFCNISANTLADRAFFSDFVEFMAANTELSRNLIFEFSQEDVDAHRAEIDEYISRLGRLGFYFSLDRVNDLTKLDIGLMSRKRFKYIKIDCAQLLDRNKPADTAEQGAEAAAPAIIGVNVAALKRVLDVHGIDLIAEKIESEQDLIELLDYRIDYGQGYLFGEPRISKDIVATAA